MEGVIKHKGFVTAAPQNLSTVMDKKLSRLFSQDGKKKVCAVNAYIQKKKYMVGQTHQKKSTRRSKTDAFLEQGLLKSNKIVAKQNTGLKALE